jgi:hypothetical protein
MKTYVGVDPGKTGAVAVLRSDEITFYDYPVPDLRMIIKPDEEIFIAIERAQAWPGDIKKACPACGRVPSQGSVATFNYGKEYGIYLGTFVALGLPYAEIQPIQWKREFSLLKTDKKTSVDMAVKLFPGVADQLKLVKHHGRAEALLIAEYARRKNM